MPKKLTAVENHRIDAAVRHFVDNRRSFELVTEALLESLTQDPELMDFIHFTSHRVKAEDSLRAKLERLALSMEGRSVAGDIDTIDTSNLFEAITDLAGLRIIHLHTEQLIHIHPLILKILEREKYTLVGQPTAYCWDVEYQELFEGVGIETRQRQSMYTTVHYDILAKRETGIRCELQVRSLVDEVWAEVSHRVNYPSVSPSATCRDQLKVLARLTSGCGRLVDSIFKTHHEAMHRGSQAIDSTVEQLEFKDRAFRFVDVSEVRRSESRLSMDYVSDEEQEPARTIP